MQVFQENENGIIQIIIKGRLAVGEENIRLLFDLCDLEYISSVGLRLILQTAKDVYEKGGQIVLCCSNEIVREILESSKLPIAETVEAGIKKLV